MDNPAFDVDKLELPPPTEVSPVSQNQVNEEIEPVVVLNPGESQTKEIPKRSSLATFGLLLAGWFVGNLIILTAMASVAIVTVGSTGLVRVPVLTEYLFGKQVASINPVESFALDEANTKLSEISALPKGQTIHSLTLSENEINALLDKQINTGTGFPIGNQQLKLTNNQFVFTGNLISTNAPVKIVGSVQVDGTAAKVSIEEAKFGKLGIPVVLASSIVDSSLSKIGLSLSGATIPAQSLQILDGRVILQDVSNPND